MTVHIDGLTMTIEDVARVARPANGGFAKAALDPTARKKLDETRAIIDEKWMNDEIPLIYAFNTGSAAFRDRRVLVEDMEQLQRNTIYSHATGAGEPFAEDATRAMMLLRVNAIASNFAGSRTQIADRLLEFLNRELHPIIPQKGSVGASGDLAPLAHMAGAVCGFEEAEIVYKGRRMRAVEALEAAGMETSVRLTGKDASALLNGTATSLAVAALSAYDMRQLLKHADIALCLSLEAVRGETNAFDPRLHAAKPHPGQGKVARNVLRILEGTKRCSAGAREIVFPAENRQPGTPATPRVQDVYSLRCAPQVHGPVADALEYIERVIVTEMNSAQDNPLVFPDGEGGLVSLSGGHFHAQYLAQVMDLMAIALADLGSISERRLARLIDPTMSYGLPQNLVAGKPGLNTGFPTVQCSMSALVMENRHLATPGSVDSIPGKGNVEDHISNSTWCSRKGRTVLENVQQIVAGELLMAAQGLSLVEPLTKDFPLGKGSRAALDAIRAEISPCLDGDRWYADDMRNALELLKSGEIVKKVEAAVGALE